MKGPTDREIDHIIYQAVPIKWANSWDCQGHVRKIIERFLAIRGETE